MIEFYPEIRMVHVAAVVVSGLLFVLRGGAVLAGARWGMAAPVRYLSYAIDATLLTAALMLLTLLPTALFANGWLAAKLGLLLFYIVLGSFALRRGRTLRARVLCFVAAVTTYAAMLGIARAHHPLGWLAPWLA